MAKFTLPNQAAPQVLKSSIRIPVNMLTKIEKDMEESGYNRKQRNQWMIMVIGELLERSDYPSLISEEFIVPGSTESIPFIFPEELDVAMNKALEEVKSTENINKDRSALIRTAITQRLMAKAGQQMSSPETLNRKIAEMGGNQ